MSKLVLVGCVEETELQTNSIGYHLIRQPDAKGYYCIEKIQYIKITVRIAQTGKILRTNEVRGPQPALRCQQRENFGNSRRIYRIGGPADVTKIWELIKDLAFLELK